MLHPSADALADVGRLLARLIDALGTNTAARYWVRTVHRCRDGVPTPSLWVPKWADASSTSMTC
jgi:hypothetical protein